MQREFIPIHRTVSNSRIGLHSYLKIQSNIQSFYYSVFQKNQFYCFTTGDFHNLPVKYT